MNLILKVSIEGVSGNDVFRYVTYGLPTGLGLLDKVREDFSGAALEQICLNDWMLLHGGKPVNGYDVKDHDGGWNICLTEPLARQSGKFENCSVVSTVLTLDEFKKAVRLSVVKSGREGETIKYIVTPTVERQVVYDSWATDGFKVDR